MKRTKTFGLLNRMMLRTIKQNLMQFIAIIVIGAIAVTLFVGLEANAIVFESQVEEVYEAGNLADLWVTTESYDKEDFEKIQSIIDGKGQMESRLYLPSQSAVHSLFLTVVDKIPTISKPYGNVSNYEGNTEDDFIYVDNDLLKDSGSYSVMYEPGGEFSFSFDISRYNLSGIASLLDEYVKDGGENIFAKDSINFKTTIDGTMDHPENITRAAYNFSVVLVSNKRLRRVLKETLEANYKEEIIDQLYMYAANFMDFNINDDEPLINPNQYVVKLDNKNDIQKIKNEINQYYQNKEKNNLYKILEREGMPFYMTIGNDLKQARNFTYIFPFVFFLVGVLVILTTISQMILRDRTQIGTLKAIGVSKGMIMLHYGGLTATLVFIGTAIGEIVGPILLPKILGVKYDILYHLPEIKYQFPWVMGILTLTSFIFVAVLVTYIIARKEISLKPSESMRPKEISFKNKKNNNRLKRKKFFSLKMAFRNIKMNFGKSLMVIVGVLGCTALLVCGFGIENTLTYGIDNDINIFYSSDLTVVLSNYKTKQEIDEILDDFDEFEYKEYFIHAATQVYKNDDLEITSNVYIIPDDCVAVHVDFDKDGAAVSKQLAKDLSLKVGDYVNFTYNSIDYKVKVSKIYDAFYYNGIIVHSGSEIFKNVSEFRYTLLEIGVKDDNLIEENFKKFEELSFVSEVRTPEHWIEMTNSLMSGISVMTNAVKIFAILLGIVVIYNLTLMNFKEKSRDIATLKVLGFSQLEIMKSLIIESLFLTIIGVLFGLLFGYPFMLGVLENNKVSLVSYIYHISFKTYIIAFILTFGVAVVINMLLSLRIRSVKMVESLKSVE